MTDNKNEIDPKQIQFLKYNMRANLVLCISGYALSLVLFAGSVNSMKSQDWVNAILYGVIGYYDCHLGDGQRRKYMKIRNALDEYHRTKKNR